MNSAKFLAAVAVIGLGTAVAFSQFTKGPRQAAANKTCRDQYAAAVAAGKKPPRDLSEVKQVWVDRNGQSICGLGGTTWSANNSAAIQ